MKQFWRFLFLLFVAHPALSDEHHQTVTIKSTDSASTKSIPCELITDFNRTQPKLFADYKNAGLSPYWAQEMVGSDVAKEMMSKEHSLPKTNVAIIERGLNLNVVPLKNNNNTSKANYDKHGTAVASLIFSNTPIGVSSKAQLSHFGQVKQMFDLGQKLRELSQTDAKIVNISGSLFGSSDIHTHIKIMSERSDGKSQIVVVAAGNDYKVRATDKNIERLNGVSVGSLDYLGMPSKFSNESEKITIGAPADYSILSQTGEKQLVETIFEGTSAATPLVSGALADVASILPDLTSEEAKLILQKTATKTFNYFEHPQKNGAGMLNHYKLLETAKRLNEFCPSKTYPEHIFRSRCRMQLLNGTQKVKIDGQELFVFDFTQIPKKNYTQVSEAFPECFSNLMNQPQKTKSCEVRKAALSELRRMFFLDPEDTASAALLGCIYNGEGAWSNAKFYNTKALMNQHGELRYASSRKEELLKHLQAGGEKTSALLNMLKD